MEPGTDTITFLLTGVLPFVLLCAILISLPTSWGLLKLYKRAVIRTMDKLSRQTELVQTHPAKESPGAPPEVELTIRVLEPSQIPERTAPSPRQKVLLKAPTRASMVYLLAGISHAVVMTLVILIAGQFSAAATRISILMMIFSWPVTLAAQLISGTTRQKWWRPMILYWGLYIIVALLAKIINPEATFFNLFGLWGIFNIPTTLIWWILLNRRLRPVSPLVMIFLLLGVTGSLAMVELLFYSDLALGLTVTILRPLGLGVRGWIITNILIGFLVFCLLGWLVLRWIRWQYQHQKISDQIIALDALWMFYSVFEVVFLVFEGLRWALTPLLAFVVYKVVTEIGFRWLSRQNRVSVPPCLLLLRVFSLGRRSEQLFDAISSHWRYLGNIHLIAGPDLATTTIEPHEFLDYVSGKLSDNYIDCAEKLESALADCKQHPDRDSRYRVQEFFCYGDTWKMVLARLAETCDAVLMDLRGFTPQNAGCIFEINTLIHHLPLDRVVFTVDATTNRDFLKDTIKNAWKNVALDSPNRDLTNPTLDLFEYQHNQNLATDRLLDTLCEATRLETG